MIVWGSGESMEKKGMVMLGQQVKRKEEVDYVSIVIKIPSVPIETAQASMFGEYKDMIVLWWAFLCTI